MANTAESSEIGVSFTQGIVKISFLLLFLGIVFSLGQTTILGFQYLYTFDYSSFLITSVLVVPLFLAILMCIAAFATLFIEPYMQFTLLKKSLGSSKKYKKFITRIEILKLIYLLSIPVFIILAFLVSKQNFPVWLAFYAVLSFSLLFMIKFLKRRWFVTDEVEHISQNGLDIILDKTILHLVGTVNGVLILSVLVFASGYAHISLQDKETSDTIIYFTNNAPSQEVNILASNANVIAIYTQNKLQIIPRDQILKFEYISKVARKENKKGQ